LEIVFSFVLTILLRTMSLPETKEIAELKMKLAASAAALQSFIDSNYFCQKKTLEEASDKVRTSASDGYEHSAGLDSDWEDEEIREYKAKEALLCSATKDNFAEIASSIINPTPLKEYFGGKKNTFVYEYNKDPSAEDEETDSVMSAREQAEQDKLFERIVVKPLDHQEKKDEVAALRIASKKPAPILWRRFECVFAMREGDWHGDICRHLEEQCQQYLDDYMEEGAVITESTLTKCPEYGKEFES